MAADGRRHVLAIGGLGPLPRDQGRIVPKLIGRALELSGRPAPRLCLLNTAMGDDPGSFLRMYQLLSGAPGRVTHLQLFPMPNAADPADLLLSQDVIFVGGGSVANMLAVWRTHAIDAALASAWRSGVVLAGVSAGAICWFEGGTTDSFGPELRPFTAGLGLLRGSYCPHYDSEPARRPLFRSLIADGALAPGIACDDGAAAHFADDGLSEIVTDRPGARGYRVQRDADGTAAETALPATML
jgi:peptidase E